MRARKPRRGARRKRKKGSERRRSVVGRNVRRTRRRVKCSRKKTTQKVKGAPTTRTRMEKSRTEGGAAPGKIYFLRQLAFSRD